MRYLALALIFFFISCAHIGKSGVYLKIGPQDSIKSIAKRYKVSKELIMAANPGKAFQPGKLFFIPQNRGVLGRTSVQQYMNDRSPADYSVPTGRSGFIWPVPSIGKISSHYGHRWGRKHEGLDIAAPRGAKIVAAQEGLVVFSGTRFGGYGKIIVIGHSNGYFTVYAHNHRNFVRKGQKVMRGQVIGQVGSTGRSTGPHLHFEIRYNGKSYDPMMFLKKPHLKRRYAKR
jgi:murein DD-endopeptidase MepM/ murein hydrolase activator NlpD